MNPKPCLGFGGCFDWPDWASSLHDANLIIVKGDVQRQQKTFDMATDEELSRWQAIYERHLGEGIDHGTICRAWPNLTLAPLHNAEYGLFHWGDARRSLRALEKGESCVCMSVISGNRAWDKDGASVFKGVSGV